MSRQWMQWLLAASLLAPTASMAAKKIYLITNRGCEEVCKSFKATVESQGDVAFILRDADGDIGRVAAFVAEIRKLQPDLVATWGTGITQAVVGKIDAVDPARHITDIPVVYMYVGNPVESGIARNTERSGRRNVAGTNIQVPLDAQINLLGAYRKVERIGMLYNQNEPAAVSQAQSVQRTFEANGIQVQSIVLRQGLNGQPDPASIEPTLDKLAQNRPDFLYYIGSTFTLEHIQRISTGAIQRGIPMFSAQEPAYRKGEILLGLVSPLAGIGQIAGYQAEKILFQGKTPGNLPTPTLSRHSVLINMRPAKALKAYPPMKLLQFAEITE